MALRSTQPLTEMSTWIFLGGKLRPPPRKADNLTAICEPTVSQPYGPSRPVTLHMASHQGDLGSRSVHVGCGGESGAGAGFLCVHQSPPSICIPLADPHYYSILLCSTPYICYLTPSAQSVYIYNMRCRFTCFSLSAIIRHYTCTWLFFPLPTLTNVYTPVYFTPVLCILVQFHCAYLNCKTLKY
jgi:hypothetical protein